MAKIDFVKILGVGGPIDLKLTLSGFITPPKFHSSEIFTQD